MSVTSSTSLAVISDSISPTSAIPSAYGAIVDNVAPVHGTSGSPRVGRLSGSAPSSPTFGTARCTVTVITVSTTIATSGAGTAVVSLGSNTLIASPAATIGYTNHGTPTRCGTCAEKMRIASALTNPTITLRGTNRISLATPSRPSTICRTPASNTVAIR